MSAPLTELSSSISSSGYTDGLGRRALAFDRVTGGMLEHLHLRPDLAAFEHGIRDRVANLSAFEDDHFARVYRTERDTETGELKIVSAFVPGTRLSDLIDTAESAGFVPGVDVAIGFLLNALPALTTLHNTVGFAHGLIDPARTVVATNGHIVFLDPALGNVMERLGLSRRRLWTSFGIAAAPSSQSPRFDAGSDIAQVALTAVMLVLGRRLRESEYPDGIASLLVEVVDVAQIRGSGAFASGFQRILQRSLPISGSRPYAAAEEMTSDLRMLVRREIGVDACRASLVDFVERMDAAFALTPSIDEDGRPPSWQHENKTQRITSPAIEVAFDDVDAFGFDPASIEAVVEPEAAEATASAVDDDEDGELEFEISLDEISIPRPRAVVANVNADVVYDLSTLDAIAKVQTAAAAPLEPAVTVIPSEPEQAVEPHHPDPTPDASTTDRIDVAPVGSTNPETPADANTVGAVEARAEIPLEANTETPVETAKAATAIGEAPRTEHRAEVTVDPAPEQNDPPAISGSVVPSDAASEASQTEPAAAAPKAATSRRKRRHKSVRARKDKLRSTSSAALLGKQNAPAPPSSKSGWLVPPDRARALEEFTPAPHAHVPTPTATQAAPTPIHMAGGMSPPPVSVRPEAAYQPPNSLPATPPQPVVQAAPPPMPRFGAPAATAAPTSLATVAPIAVAGVVKPDAPAVKIKSEPPAGYQPPRKRRIDPSPDGAHDSAIGGQHIHQRELFQNEQPKSFPWKLAAAALVIVAIGVVGGRAYLAGRNAQAALAAAPVEPAAEPETPAGPPKGKGQIIVQTEPAGARVLLDGKPVGESPMTLDAIAPGRHTVTFISSSGTIKKTVRVAAGKIVTLNVPVFSGWLALFAPVVLDVSEDGKSLGTTEDKRLMIAPGHHKLTLTNRELGYSAVQEVDVDAGQVTSLTIDPRGTANFNAIPWAEVWMDGRKLGDTPLASLPVPLGVRDFIFKHPEHGERRVTMTVRADEPAVVSVDLTKPQ
jgi:PEGA domain